MRTRGTADGEDYVERIPPPRHPRPPPPPPPPATRNGATPTSSLPRSPKRQQPQSPRQAATQTTNPIVNDKTDWVLRVRLPPRQRHYYAQVRKIRISSEMTVDTLAACLNQAINASVAGLFMENSQLFYSLQSILKLDPEEQGHIYVAELEPPPPPASITSWWDVLMHCIVPLVAIYTVYTHGQSAILYAASCCATLFNITIQWPLKELYRFGPWFVGWEGESLARICARITYHGDEAFWDRNMLECERIFFAKEQAWMRLARPLVYILIFILCVYVAKLLLREWNLRYHRPSPVDREMQELYRSFGVILRQGQKMSDSARLSADRKYR